jgi:hypothetical protein
VRTKVTLVLVFLNVALFFFIFKFERNWRTEAASLEARRRVLGPEAADIRMLELTTATHAGEYRLERKRDTWSLKKPFDWPANQNAAQSIVSELQMLEQVASFSVADLAKNNQSLADFGLDKPKLTVTFVSGDPAATAAAPRPKTVLQIGDPTKDAKRLYILSPAGDRVHVVNRTLIDTLSIPLPQLRADTLMTVRVFEARSLLVQSAAPAAESARTGGGLRVRIRHDATRWVFEAPITARASKTGVELAINELNGLHAKSFPARPPAVMPAAAPILRVSVEGNNRVETLLLGEPVAPAGGPAPGAAGVTPPGESGTREYYAQLEGRTALFTVEVKTALVELLRDAQETLREKRILEFEPAAVTALTLAAPMQPNQPPLELQRLEPPAGQAATTAPLWQLVRRTSGPQGTAQTLLADRPAVQRLLERLALLSADHFKSDAPTSADLEEWGFNRPAREITLASASGGGPIVLRLGTDPSRNVYARVTTPNDPGTSIYQVRSDILNELPLSPLAWRDRAVGEPLPSAARFTALKLTDLESKQVLFDATLNAAGEATPAPTDPKALTTLLSALRAMRAREFLPGGYTEKVVAGGEERPWRFQLDAALALPGPGGLEQKDTRTLFLTERVGGTEQFAGLKEQDTVFSLEQPVVDALWSLAYGPRDLGPRPEQKK